MKDKQKPWIYANIVIIFLSFVVVLLVDMFVKYTSGDDVSHRLMAEKYSLWEFIKNCETSRISKKISLYFVMRSDIMVWRVLNAAVFTLLFWALSKIIFTVKMILDFRNRFYIRLVLLISMCFAHISIVGFTVFWVTGTQDYLWPLTFGVLSLIPEIQCTYGKNMNFFTFLCAVFCALWGGVGQEQISFMLICIAALNCVCERINGVSQKDRIYSFALLLIRILCFVFLLLAPMNQIRMTDHSYYTGFSNLLLLEHLFLTVQWELSAFANEMKLLFVSIWLILGLSWYHNKNWKKLAIVVFMVICTLPSFIGISFLNDVGISTLTDMGIVVENIVEATDNTVSISTMSIINWIGFVWWFISTMLVTPYLLKDRKDCCFIYVLGMILPLMMVASASMYVSGGRIFWMSSVLLSVVIGMLITEKWAEKKYILLGCAAVIFGIYEIVIDMVYFIENII